MIRRSRGYAPLPFMMSAGYKGSVLAISDAATGVVFCWSAMYGAAVNVTVINNSGNARAFAEGMVCQIEVQQKEGYVGGSKRISTPGASSYLYPIFIRLGIITTQKAVQA